MISRSSGIMWKCFPPNRSLLNTQQSQEKTGWEKRKKPRGERAKSKSLRGRETFQPKNEILLSAHSRTSEAVIYRLERRTVYRLIFNQNLGKFLYFLAKRWVENNLNSFRSRFSAKVPGAYGLMGLCTKLQGFSLCLVYNFIFIHSYISESVAL